MSTETLVFTLPTPIIQPHSGAPGATPDSDTLSGVVTQIRIPGGNPAGEPIVAGPTDRPFTVDLPDNLGFGSFLDAGKTPGVESSVAPSAPVTSSSASTKSSTGNPRTSTGSSNGPSQTSTAAPRNSSTSNATSHSNSGSTTSHRNTNPISAGAAAGIGIGCAIAGALIAAAILLLFFRRRRRRSPARSDVIPLNGFASVEKTMASPDSIGPAGMIERSLPQPAEDQALGGEMSRLKTAIKNHVQSYYHTDQVKGGVDQAALGLIATGNMPLIASTLGSLLSNPVTRMTAIRFCITWTVVSRIDQNCEPSLSFLPPEIASCLQSISSTRDDPSTKPGFMSRWKAYTAALLHDRYSSTTLTASDSRNRNISEALQALDTVLHSFADPQRDDRERLQKLEEIVKRGARFGFTVFSQPSLLEFDWNTAPSAGRGTLVISPALTQVTDDNGRRLPRPRVLEEQDVARGLESYF
ncbi:MAG: hypothetical protein Q9168_006376 [Polycauliona sp. 1 TL-2023]